MNKNILLALLIMVLFISNKADAEKSFEFKIPQIHTQQIKDSLSGRQYELYIKLPKGYEKNHEEKYPVIYTMDGNWRFEHLYNASKLKKNAILVGVSFENGMDGIKSRSRDFSPAKIKVWQEKTGEAANHLSFIRNDVMKFIESHYRTNPKERTFVGYSLGGLFGAYILLAEPETFDNYILGSPSIFYVQQYMDDLEENVARNRKKMKVNVFISVGGAESKSEYIEPIADFVKKLRSRNYSGLTLHHEVFKAIGHDEGNMMSVVGGMYWLKHLTNK